MTVLVLSDIHANIDALEAVLADAAGYDAVWFLGDVVGYGPDPEACVARLRWLAPEHWLAGNHDWAAVGRMDTHEFNPDARTAAHWSGRQLSSESFDWIRSLEPRADLADSGITLVHGSPRQPVWEYVLDRNVAAEGFAHMTSRVCFHGHTHQPTAFEEAVDGVVRHGSDAVGGVDISLGRWMVNPGSVGQPRDGDPRASYALYDPGRQRFAVHRVAYDISAVQRKMASRGLPSALETRLEFGW